MACDRIFFSCKCLVTVPHVVHRCECGGQWSGGMLSNTNQQVVRLPDIAYSEDGEDYE